MTAPQPRKFHESASHRRTFSAVAARRLCGRQMVLLLIVFSVPLAIMAAPASRATEIHDHLRKASEFLKSNDPNSAAKEFHAVLELDPKNAEANANLGVIAFSHRDYHNASQYLRQALQTDPSLIKTQALLGICLRRLGDPSARALLEKSFPKLKDKQLRIQVGMELAGLYDQQGDPGATASVIQALVDLDPDNVDVLFTAQRVYSELADDTLDKLAVLAPGSARMQQVIAEHLVNGGNLKGAIEHYRKALQLDPRLPVHFELGEAILESSPSDAGTQAEAQKEFEVAVTVDGDTAKTECEFGNIALLQSKPDEAFAHYQRAYQLNPNEVQAQMGLAKLLTMQEKPQEAIKYLRMATQVDPLNSEAHYRLALACRNLNLTDEAKKEMHLFQEIKKAKDQVKELYHQMNRLPKPDEESNDAQPKNAQSGNDQ